MTRAELDAEVLAWISEGVDAPPDEARFDRLARAMFQHQYDANEPYRKLCQAFGRGPDDVGHWSEIPAVPTGAFKEARLAAFPESRTARVFRTSGSSTEARGELHLDTLELYEASLLATFGAFVCPDRVRLLVLAPPLGDAQDSSLSYMFDAAVRTLGGDGSRFVFGHGGFDMAVAMTALQRAREPVGVCGTAFAFVHLLDALAAIGLRISLPEGSRVMETGGFKGRSRELPREELHGGLSRALGVPRDRIVNQYGMCELGSQFYEPSLVTGRPTVRKRIPPWVRTRVVDPADLRDAGSGVLIHYDLANTGSVLAVQTADAGTLDEEGLEVIGRIPGAEARGCSIAADALLGGT
jgi:hypothetical protein